MSKLLWFLGGTTLALAVFAILHAPEPLAVDGVDEAAGRVGAWGTKQRVFGAGGGLKGRVEQGIANVTGDPDLGDKGVFDEAAGRVQNVAGQAAQALGDTIHDLNR